MNADLETELAGTELRSLVEELLAAPQRKVPDDFRNQVMSQLHHHRWRSPWRLLPLAAGFAVMLACGALLLRQPQCDATTRLVSYQRQDGTFSTSSSAPYVQSFAVSALARAPHPDLQALAAAVSALVRTQTAEGGWANAQLSARNTAALSAAAAAGIGIARDAYRKGLRYLRIQGISELSADDLAREAKLAATRLGASRDQGLVCSVALCAKHP